jgi:competence protein ComEA
MKSVQLVLASTSILFSSWLFAAPVNINQATASEIAESLSGIGMSKAEAIVAYRNENGKFSSADDIVKVKGIGNSTLEKNKLDILVK